MKYIIFIIATLMIALASCNSTSDREIATVSKNPKTQSPSLAPAPVPAEAIAIRPTVTLSDDIVQQGLANCINAESWGISLAKVPVNYKIGVQVDAFLIVHNGNDYNRLVEISYKPIKAPAIDASTGKCYNPTPVEAYDWVSIDVKEIRMEKMQTEVIPIHFYIPSDYSKELPGNWEFQISTAGIKVADYEYTIKVVTSDNDTTLSVHLPYPLLRNNLNAVKDIISREPEDKPIAIHYDSDKGMLDIANLAELKERDITIFYEYGSPIIVCPKQRWLITMIK